MMAPQQDVAEPFAETEGHGLDENEDQLELGGNGDLDDELAEILLKEAAEALMTETNQEATRAAKKKAKRDRQRDKKKQAKKGAEPDTDPETESEHEHGLGITLGVKEETKPESIEHQELEPELKEEEANKEDVPTETDEEDSEGSDSTARPPSRQRRQAAKGFPSAGDSRTPGSEASVYDIPKDLAVLFDPSEFPNVPPESRKLTAWIAYEHTRRVAVEDIALQRATKFASLGLSRHHVLKIAKGPTTQEEIYLLRMLLAEQEAAVTAMIVKLRLEQKMEGLQEENRELGEETDELERTVAVLERTIVALERRAEEQPRIAEQQRRRAEMAERALEAMRRQRDEAKRAL